MKWYVVNVLVGKEKKIKKLLKERIRKENLSEHFEEIYIPSEKIKKKSRGKQKEVNQRIFPGYILVRMEMNDKTWHVVKNTNGIGGFVSAESEPMTLSDEKVSKIKNESEDRRSTLQKKTDFRVGEKVRIIDGPFASFNGVVENILSEKSKLRVMVSIFGRKTPVELDYDQVKKDK
ncbi:MAG: transcription termination/antitermination factor NusG [Candidatus Mcinerneyibacterium aminivorans]|uniref:Transcription termination/antitermination protein NusG n=1 Tax=Candidatus Mcinerneyibacterium aminivorans TaxID=2703815 RepID=A0A5D0ME53_9BACT|nr:MAG: transcription termination/antitermination factor NusG [Candidatus Mcinerneyibacterium aminivorans]